VASTTVFNYVGPLFGTDVERVLCDLIAPGSDHSHTAIHALFVLFFDRLGSLLAAALGLPSARLYCESRGRVNGG
jgi:hypothetical protein